MPVRYCAQDPSLSELEPGSATVQALIGQIATSVSGLVALILGLGGMIATADTAFGNPQCDARDRVLAFLSDRYGETRRSFGLSDQAAVMELFAAENTGTWTITMTLPDRQMCLVASGAGYEAVTEELPAKGHRV